MGQGLLMVFSPCMGSDSKHKRIFTDEAAQDEVKADTDLNNILRKIIMEEMIAPYAYHTGCNAADVICPLITNASRTLAPS
jgi:hypothetical protein